MITTTMNNSVSVNGHLPPPEISLRRKGKKHFSVHTKDGKGQWTPFIVDGKPAIVTRSKTKRFKRNLARQNNPPRPRDTSDSNLISILRMANCAQELRLDLHDIDLNKDGKFECQSCGTSIYLGKGFFIFQENEKIKCPRCGARHNVFCGI